MAVYFDYHIQSPSHSSRSLTHHEIEWHNNFSMLAVASKNETRDVDGLVNFFLDEGELLEDASIHRSAVVECMQWHPEKKLIAIGWSSGEITTYNHSEQEVFEQSSIHRSPISVLQWNKNGSRLIAGDESGLLLVWKIEGRGQLHPMPLHQHRLHSALTHCVMLHPIQSSEIKGGSVLEAYSWHGRNAAEIAKSVHDPIACFCATSDGAVLFMNHSGECVEWYHMESTIHSLLLYNDMQLLAVISTEMLLTQFSVTPSGQTSQTMSAKLSGRNKPKSIIFVADRVLASCSNENVIRFWDSEHSDNYVLSIRQQAVVEEVVTNISYNRSNEVLAAVTSGGNLVLWKWKGVAAGKNVDGPNKWELITSSALSGPAIHVKWGSKRNLLAVNCANTVQILSEHIMKSHFNQQVSAVQVSPSEVLVEYHNTGTVHNIKADIHIRGVFTTKEHVAVWSGKKLAVYAISQDKAIVRDAGSFHTDTQTAVLYEHNIYTVDRNQICVRAFQGTVKQLLSCEGQEGYPVVLNVVGHFLIAGTDSSYVKVWDLTRREAKLHASVCLSESTVPDCSRIVSVQCNCNGSRISIHTELVDAKYHQLVLWDVDSDSLKFFSPTTILEQSSPRSSEPSSSASCTTLPELTESALNEQLQLLQELLGRHPVSHYWDPTEPRLLVVESAALQQEGGSPFGRRSGSLENWLATKRRSGKHSQTGVVVSSLLVTQDLNVLVSDVIPSQPSFYKFIGVSIPFLYFSKKVMGSLSSSQETQVLGGPSTVARVTLRDFVGLEDSDASTLHAMMDFIFHSTLGNMDEAFKSIKLIKSKTVWESMARMCVKTHRLDVAAVCLGNMGNARAAKAVREAQDIPELEARLAVLAVQLGMLEEAEEFYKKSKRFDLLNSFYQASGQWPMAMEVAELNDRVHLKTTYYNYAKHAESLGEYTAATNSYEKSDTHQFEVPRMLFDDPLELENYVMKSKDKGIRKWWAEYLESLGEWEQAMQFYETAKDYYSVVRILCFNGQIDRAIAVAEESGSKSAAYHLARNLSVENGDAKKAIYFYTKAQCYTPAIQLAREHGLDSELMNLALLSSQEDMIEAARYYEDNPETLDKAIMLYHKSHEISKALELCFKHQQFDTLHHIAEDLGEDSSPEMTKKVADFFMEHGQFEKALELLVRNKRLSEALELCMAHNITLTEELVERMTVTKKPNETPEENEQRVQLLEKLAECCVNQGAYHLATKKFTQAGNKTKAMKALLKSGDTEKIAFFAGVSRQKDVYVMAANYLQSLDWRQNAEIMKNIISFYTKGRALESLAGFYDACAQVEIDEYQNYAKALGALNEAVKSLSKAKPKNPAAMEEKITFFKERIDLVKKFAEARRVYEEDHDECMRQCQSLLDEPNLETAVRLGDVYGLMIEHYGQVGNYDQAYSLMKEMRQRIPSVNLAYYIDIRTIETVHSALGIPLGRGIGGDVNSGGRKGEGGVSEESEGEESVGEEVED